MKCLFTLELSHRPVTFWTFSFQKVVYAFLLQESKSVHINCAILPFSPSLCGCSTVFVTNANWEFIWNASHHFYLFLCSICGDAYPCFEISAVNADKPPLTVSQIKDRVKQFEKVGEVDSLYYFPRFIKFINFSKICLF